MKHDNPESLTVMYHDRRTKQHILCQILDKIDDVGVKLCLPSMIGETRSHTSNRITIWIPVHSRLLTTLEERPLKSSKVIDEECAENQVSIVESSRYGRMIISTKTEPISVGDPVMSSMAYGVVLSDSLRASHCNWCFNRLVDSHGQAALKSKRHCASCLRTLYCSERCEELDARLHRPQCQVIAALDRIQQRNEQRKQDDTEILRLIVTLLVMRRIVQYWPFEQYLLADPQSETKHPLAADDRSKLEQVYRLLRQFSPALLHRFSAPEFRRLFYHLKFYTHPLVVQGQEVIGLGYFPLASQMNHACVPNTSYAYDPTQRSLVFHSSSSSIVSGSELSYAYIADLYQARSSRQELLRQSFSFDCECTQCILPIHLTSDEWLAKDNGCPQSLVKEYETLVRESTADHGLLYRALVRLSKESMVFHNLHAQHELRYAISCSILHLAVLRQAFDVALEYSQVLIQMWCQYLGPHHSSVVHPQLAALTRLYHQAKIKTTHTSKQGQIFLKK